MAALLLVLIVLHRSLQKLQNAPRYVRVCSLTGEGKASPRDGMGSTAGAKADLGYILRRVFWAHGVFVSKFFKALF